MIKLPIAALVVIVGLLGGFYGGYKVGGGGTTASAAASTTGTRAVGTGFGGRGLATACPSPGATPAASGGGARRGATGTIANLTASSLTIRDIRCNTDVTVTFDQSVIVRKTVVGQRSDLQESETIAVTGARQADGSIKANSISIIPAGSGGPGGFGGGAGATGG